MSKVITINAKQEHHEIYYSDMEYKYTEVMGDVEINDVIINIGFNKRLKNENVNISWHWILKAGIFELFVVADENYSTHKDDEFIIVYNEI